MACQIHYGIIDWNYWMVIDQGWMRILTFLTKTLIFLTGASQTKWLVGLCYLQDNKCYID